MTGYFLNKIKSLETDIVKRTEVKTDANVVKSEPL